MSAEEPPPRIKICGITRRQDAEEAAAAGAELLGVILAPGGRRSVAPARAAELLRDLPVRRVGVWVDASLDGLRREAEAAEVDVVQLHGDEDPTRVAQLREEGRWEVWKALRPRDGAEFVALLERYAGAADALLLDGWSPAAQGGVGARLPLDEIVDQLASAPAGAKLIAAGGLRAENVGEVVLRLRPHGVDVSSGVESAPGVKDRALLRGFVAAARRAGR
ncbi:MAG: phosphoribosylanthranilate isomerase [Gemmatimonadota bacterium]|nr:phosphoribosylanthranilate isomerase [Gemmatimonadota bacterium]